MRLILEKTSLRYIFAANVVSMLGSGMNAAAVAWFVLKATHSETALGTLAIFQTIPAMLMLPFTGVIIDREDRRRLVMMLDAARAIIILVVSILAFRGKAQVWELYGMATLVAAGFWMFWPTVTALIRELTPDSEFVQANSFLLAGVQGGWLMAGAVVGFMYEHVGLGGVLLIDFATYVFSFLCYLLVRKGRHVVPRPAELRADILAAESQAERYWREMNDGVHFLRQNRSVLFLGSNDHRRGSDAVAQRPRLSCRRNRVWLVERGMGNRRLPQRALCTANDRESRLAALCCDFHGSAGHLHDTGAIFQVSSGCRRPVRDHGLGTRDQRHCHEYQSDEAGAEPLHGTRAEHILFFRNWLAGGSRNHRRRGRAPSEPGNRIRHPRPRVCARLRHLDLAHRRTEGRSGTIGGVRSLLGLGGFTRHE